MSLPNRVLMRLHQGDSDGAMDLLALVTPQDLSDGRRYALDALVRIEVGEARSALSLLDQAQRDCHPALIGRLRARAHIRLGQWSEAREALIAGEAGEVSEHAWLDLLESVEEEVDAGQDPLLWLREAVEQDVGLRRIVEALPAGEACLRLLEALNRLQGDWRVMLEKSPEEVAEWLFSLAETILEADDLYLTAARALRREAALILAASGYPRAARERLGELLAIHGDKPDPSDLAVYADLLEAIGAGENEVLRARHRTLVRAEEEFEGSSKICTEASRKLARAYTDYGFAVEARRVLTRQVQRDREDEGLQDEFRRVLVREALGTEPPPELPTLAEEVALEPAGVPLEKATLGILFQKAEECFESLGEDHGMEVLDTARALKDSLRDKDLDQARELESRLARIVASWEDRRA